MEWKVVDDYTSVRIDDSVVSTFKEWIHEKKPNCKVVLKLCEPTFWMTREERQALQGPVGWHGCAGPRGPTGPTGPGTWQDTRAVADPKKVVVTISFVMSKKHAEQIKDYKLHFTPNPLGERLPTWNVCEFTEQVPFCCGVYKKRDFDEAFGAMKKLKPELTEKEFVETWGDNVVNREVFHGWTACLEAITASETVLTGKCLVGLSLLAIDMDRNFEDITTLLSAYI